jgi:hypothetical protein
MARAKPIECQFLIPITRDPATSDGQVHESTAWDWLESELID